MDEVITYMGYLWIQLDGDVVTIGVNEIGLEEFTTINSTDLPAAGAVIGPDEVCGELDTEEGPLNIYCPVDGVVIESNEAVIENPSLIQEDCMGDGWLIKVEAENPDQIDLVSLSKSNEDD